jgi:hypothetical protein
LFTDDAFFGYHHLAGSKVLPQISLQNRARRA